MNNAICKKVRRGKSRKTALESLKVMYNNINGIKLKQNALQRIIDEESPTIIGISETKLAESESFKIEGYGVERVDRVKDGGGGVLIAYKKCLENVVLVVREEKENEEMLWLKIDNNKVKLRIGIVYMPQENETKLEVIRRIYTKIEDEVEKATSNGESIILMGDLNCKTGEIIKNNTEEVSKGGRVLMNMCKKCDLTILNGEDICQGTWTRIQKDKKSVLDYMLIKKKDLSLVSNMVIDENKILTPYRINEEKEVVFTDHCMMMLKMNLKLKTKTMTHSKFMSKDGYRKFSKRMEEKSISDVLNVEEFDRTYQNWSNEVLNLIDGCSTKRKKSRGWKVNRKLLKIKKRITKQLKKQGTDKEVIRLLKVEKNLIDEFIEKENMKKNYENVNKVVRKIKSEGGVNSTAFWEFKRRIEGRTEETAHVIESDNGERLEDEEKILERYKEYFQTSLATK